MTQGLGCTACSSSIVCFGPAPMPTFTDRIEVNKLPWKYQFMDILLANVAFHGTPYKPPLKTGYHTVFTILP